jgi:hypothetical protein
MLSVITRDPIRPPRRAGSLEPVLAGMLTREPGMRWPMPKVATELERIANRAGVDATTVVERASHPATFDSARTEPPPRRRLSLGRPAAAVAVVLVLLSAVVAWSLLERGSEPGTAGDASAPRSTESSEQATPGPGPAEQSNPGDGDEAAVSPPSDPAAFTRAYFQIVPDDLDRGWRLLDSGMQQEIGRSSYVGFWQSIADVRLGDVEAVGDSAVRYEIEYVRTDGSTSQEVKELTLRPAGGSFLITGDTTLD